MLAWLVPVSTSDAVARVQAYYDSKPQVEALRFCVENSDPSIRALGRFPEEIISIIAEFMRDDLYSESASERMCLLQRWRGLENCLKNTCLLFDHYADEEMRRYWDAVHEHAKNPPSPSCHCARTMRRIRPTIKEIEMEQSDEEFRIWFRKMAQWVRSGSCGFDADSRHNTLARSSNTVTFDRLELLKRLGLSRRDGESAWFDEYNSVRCAALRFLTESALISTL